jgi:hypothetical protein
MWNLQKKITDDTKLEEDSHRRERCVWEGRGKRVMGAHTI